jgi:fructose-bisphosphate aldolase class II
MQDQLVSDQQLFGGAVTVRDGRVTVASDADLASAHMDALVRQAVFGSDREREFARWLIWEIGQAVGVRAASIHDLYIARGRGEVHGFTAPAMNVRGMAYDTARSIFARRSSSMPVPSCWRSRARRSPTRISGPPSTWR